MRLYPTLLTRVLAVVFLSGTVTAHSQPAGREVVTQPVEWASIQANIRLSEHWGVAADAQLRFAGSLESMQHMIRGGLELLISPKWSVIPVAYAYIHNYQYGEQPVTYLSDEQRVWQQVLFKHSIRRFSFQHRARLEQRWSEKFHTDANGNPVNEGYRLFVNRFRYRGMIILPLKGREKMQDKSWGITAYDEFFISWGDPVTFHEPDQNRIFAGPLYQFSKKCSLSFGPFYQMLIKANGTKQENNVGLLVNLNLNYDLRHPAN
jgi:hypothetical protein